MVARHPRSSSSSSTLALALAVAFAALSLAPNGTDALVTEVSHKVTGKVQFSINSNTIVVPNLIREKSIIDKTKHVNLTFTLEESTVDSVDLKPDTTNAWVLVMSDETKLEISSIEEQGIQQYYIMWPGSANQKQNREVCFQLGKEGKDYWFNTFQQRDQQWPMNTKVEQREFPLNAIQSNTNSDIQYVIEHMFLSSNGFVVWFDRESPLWYRVDPNKGSPRMCVTAQRRAPYLVEEPLNSEIKINLYAGLNMKQIYDVVANKRGGGIAPPEHPANDRMFSYPIWNIIQGRNRNFTTISDLTQGRIEAYVNDIKSKYHYPHGVVSLDSWWHMDSPYLGFNINQINDPKKMATNIGKLDYLLELVVSPYVSTNAEQYLAHRDLFVKDAKDSTKEWTVTQSGLPQTNHALFDFTIPKARHAFVDNLKKIQKDNNISSFVFDPITLFDNNFKFHKPAIQQASAQFTRTYLEQAKEFGYAAIVREGHRTQQLPLWVRMSDRQSNWVGLKSLIPTALALSMAGYSYFIPDVVGGRLGGIPEDELYIRWVQAVSLMPAMQFDIPPWDMKKPETQEVTRNCVLMHIANSTLLKELANKRMTTGAPIIRPMWYVEPDDVRTYTIDDQFMLGDDILVAPILEEGEEERTVFLPTGHWVQVGVVGVSGNGPNTINNVKVGPGGTVPHFKRQA